MDILFEYNLIYFLTPGNIIGVCFGTWFGMMIGALPGLGATVGCALLIPTTFSMDPIPAVLMLMGVYMGAMYGGSISSILLGVPGAPSAVVTLLDGNPMAKAGDPGRALGYSLYSSTVGGLIGGLVLLFMTDFLSILTIKLSDPELFLVGVLGLLSVATLGTNDVCKCLLSVLLGLFVGTVGMDLFTGSYRYTFGNLYLVDGIHIVPLLSGFYAFSEIFEMICGDLGARYVRDKRKLRCHVPLGEFLQVKWTVLKSSVIGVIFGIVPGLGASPATWFAYTQAKRDSADPDSFGKGNPHGLAAAESSNNAVVGGSLIPTLTLGVPGSPAAAVIASALIIHGLQPGPGLMKDSRDLVFAIYVGIFFSVLAMFVFGKFTTSLFARMLTCPAYILAPIIAIAVFIGSYAARYYMLDVWIAIICGVLIFFLKRLDFDLSAFTLAYVLAALIETRFRRSLMLSQGSLMIFINRPYCLVIWALIILMLISCIGYQRKKNRRMRQKANNTPVF